MAAGRSLTSELAEFTPTSKEVMHLRTQSLAVALAATAVAPYVTLKLLWLGGSTVGLRTAAALDEMHSARMVGGNVATIGLELVAVGLVIALARGWGMRGSARTFLVLAAGATGLLAPILLGLPAGGALELLLHGEVHTSGMDEMAWWVFALVYGGFALLAIVIASFAWRSARTRWAPVLDRSPARPAPLGVVVGAVGMIPFAVAMVWWAGFPGHGGPQQMDAVSQRVVLAVTGLLVLAGFVAPLLRSTSNRWSRRAWLALWAGCTTAALQAPTQVLLANGGHPSAVMIGLAVLAVPGAAMYGAATWTRRDSTDSRQLAVLADHETRCGCA